MDADVLVCTRHDYRYSLENFKHIFAHRSEFNPTHESESLRSEMNGIRVHAKHYEPGN